MPDQTLLTEVELLAADSKSELTALDISDFYERLANIECIFERWSVWFGIPAPNLAILALELKPHPIRRNNRSIDTGTAEHIGVIGVGPKCGASESFKTEAVFSVQ